MHQEPRLIVGTVGEGPWTSEDGGQTWRRLAHGMFVECDVRALLVDPQRPACVLAGTSEGFYRSDDGGDRWRHIDSPMDGLVIWSLLRQPSPPHALFAGTRPARLFRSLDDGRSWHRLDVDLPVPCERLIFNRVTTLRADPLDTQIVWAGVEIGGLWHSRDGGDSWSPIGSGLSSQDVHDLIIVPRPGGRRRMLLSTNNDVNLSDDDGQTWQPQQLGDRLTHKYFRGMAQRADEPGTILLGAGTGPPGDAGSGWRATDAGQSWQPLVLPGVLNSTVWGFAVHPADPRRIYAYTCSGQVFVSRDGGDDWQKLPREFGEIRSLAWTPR
jgi:photosystem II stability/assembly factor-like uncharacterized protein